MSHQKIVQELIKSVLEGEAPSQQVLKHLASCRLCFDCFVVVGELAGMQANRLLLEEIMNEFPCSDIEFEMDLFAQMSPQSLLVAHPRVAAHFGSCGYCAEKFVAARHLMEADKEGLFGRPLDLTGTQVERWSQTGSKMFQFARTIKAMLSPAQILLDTEQLLEYIRADRAEPVHVRSQDGHTIGAEQVGISIYPPTLSDEINLKLLAEPLVQATIVVEAKALKKRIVVALYKKKEQKELLEIRSLSPHQQTIRFESLNPGSYELEFRGPGGSSQISLLLQEATHD